MGSTFESSEPPVTCLFVYGKMSHFVLPFILLQASLPIMQSCNPGISADQEKSMGTVDQTKNAEEIIQSRAEGAKNCRAVKLNSESRSLLATDSQLLKLLPGSEVELQVVRGPADLSSDTLSYVFKLTDGGEGTLALRQSTSTAYGSFKPITGSVHYTVEACAGDGCNVIYERDSNFFNDFED